jgi:hypothetical protein
MFSARQPADNSLRSRAIGIAGRWVLLDLGLPLGERKP